MATISTSSKIAYIYDEPTDTWYPVAGGASTSADYDWTGDHSFSGSVDFRDVVNSKAGVNNFQNPAARESALPSPQNGAVCFIREDSSGNTVNQIFYYSLSLARWVSVNDVQLSTKTSTHTLVASDFGKTININSSSDTFLDIPPNSSVPLSVGTRLEVIRLGSGEVVFREGSGVTIRSKNSNKKLSTQYTGATLTKIDTNEWLIIGDLKA